MREILQESENTPKSNFLAKPNNIQLRNRRATPIVIQDLRFWFLHPKNRPISRMHVNYSPLTGKYL